MHATTMTPRLPLFLLLLAISLSAAAQLPRNEVDISLGRTQTEELGDAPTIGASYTRFWTRGIATRFAAQYSQEDYSDYANDTGEKSYGSYAAMGEYHFLRDRLVSPYAGGGIAYGFARRHLGNTDFTSSDGQFTYILNVGADVNITPRFAAGISGNYMKLDPDVGDRYGTILDPTTVLVSAKYKF
jgi:outer membrane protein W